MAGEQATVPYEERRAHLIRVADGSAFNGVSNDAKLIAGALILVADEIHNLSLKETR